MALGAAVSLYSGFRIMSYYRIYPNCCVAYEALARYCTFGQEWPGIKIKTRVHRLNLPF